MPMVLSLENTRRGKTHDVSMKWVKSLPGVVSSTGATYRQDTILHFDDLRQALEDNFDIRATISPERIADEVKWIMPSERMLRKLDSWATTSVLALFREVDSVGTATEFRWMRLRHADDADGKEEVEEKEKGDEDENEEIKAFERIRAISRQHAPIPRSRNHLSKRKRSSTVGMETETETDEDYTQSQSSDIENIADADEEVRKKMRDSDSSSVQNAAEILASLASITRRPAPIDTKSQTGVFWVRPKPQEKKTTPTPKAAILVSPDQPPKSPRSLAYLNQLQAVLCLSVLPCSPVSVSIPVISRETGEMEGLLLPLSWLTFMTRQICTSSIAQAQKTVEIETIEHLLGVTFPPEDIELASQLSREVLRDEVAASRPEKMNQHGMERAILIRQATYEKLARWFCHNNFKKLLCRLKTAKSIWMVNLLDWAIKYELQSEPSFNYYLASAYMRRTCRVAPPKTPFELPCTWAELPRRLGEYEMLVSMYRDMLSMFATSAEERAEFMGKYESSLRDFSAQYASFSAIHI